MRKCDKIEEQIEIQRGTIFKLIQEMQTQKTTVEEIMMQQETLNKVLEHLETQKTMLKETKQQVEHQQELLDSICRKIIDNPPPTQLKAPVNILDKLDLDVEKLAKIAMYIFNLYANSHSSSNEKANETEMAE